LSVSSDSLRILFALFAAKKYLTAQQKKDFGFEQNLQPVFRKIEVVKE
jgi:hypothetical protein